MSTVNQRLPELDFERLVEWWTRVGPSRGTPLNCTRIVGGRSNLTYLVVDDQGNRCVLRRPPNNDTTASAHDVGREYRAISGLLDTDVPVPRPLALESRPDVLGAPFYVMEYVEGLVVRTQLDAADLSVESRSRSSVSIVERLAALHNVEPESLGYKIHANAENYCLRQLRRWNDELRLTGTPYESMLRRMGEALASNTPTQRHHRIVHGDYRLDNVILDRQGNVQAVLDWELAVVGDPLADLATLLLYWVEPDDDFHPLPSPPTRMPGFLNRHDLMRIYGAAGGMTMTELPYYLAFANWRLAAALANVLMRGTTVPADVEMNGVDERLELERSVPVLVERAGRYLRTRDWRD